MRRLFATTGAAVLASAVIVVGPGTAQTGPETKLTVKAGVSPNKAGTKRNPRGVRLTVEAHWRTTAGFEKPVIERAVALFPKGSLYNGGKYRTCARRKLDVVGPPGCPKTSIMGRGTGAAYADQVITRPRFTVVNGGARRVWLHTVLTNPALVSKAVPGTVRRMSGKWRYRLTLVVPRSLRVVAGVPIALRDFRTTAGRGDWLATTSCPRNRRWPFRLTTHFNTGSPATFQDTVRCRR